MGGGYRWQARAVGIAGGHGHGSRGWQDSCLGYLGQGEVSVFRPLEEGHLPTKPDGDLRRPWHRGL